jgi:hypothetical protein
LNNFHEYLAQHSLKSGGTKDHFKQVKVPGTSPYWKAWYHMHLRILIHVMEISQKQWDLMRQGKVSKKFFFLNIACTLIFWFTRRDMGVIIDKIEKVNS